VQGISADNEVQGLRFLEERGLGLNTSKKCDGVFLPVSKLVRNHFVHDLRVVLCGKVVVPIAGTDVVLGERRALIVHAPRAPGGRIRTGDDVQNLHLQIVAKNGKTSGLLGSSKRSTH
jgi:hypothetical protein